ncbi:uncharacterized protein LOC126654991 isoform X2 [Mercurialis annua]|uniref:uncharacterized protein LOC126654991 isoform X2 n=2 Tax=Mercurialis annua TaxID=3986 RepID=UPI00215F828F|nr:uncharacterized protein LOC126654991 isoform X2 [Mercurialis annua]
MTNNTAQNAWRQEENPSSPYYIHPNENPALILVSPVLNGPNYHSWARSLKRALLAKNKMRFVDGSIPVPAKDNPLYSVWERSNNLVMSWIQNSVSPTISKSIEWIDAALDAWTDLESRFSLEDAYRVSDIQEELNGFKQNSLTVVEYFTHLKEMWDELVNLRPIPGCACDPQCKCGVFDRLKVYKDNDTVIKFLKGLNENFATFRSQILIMEPLPTINKVFSLASQHERQVSGMLPKLIEPNVFYTNTSPGNSVTDQASSSNANSNFKKADGNSSFKKFTATTSQYKCTHCGLSGHSVDRCYRKHGFPPGFKSKFKGKTAYTNQVDSAVENEQHVSNTPYSSYPSSVNMDMNRSYSAPMNTNNDSMAQNMQLTTEQYMQLMSLLNQDNNVHASANTFSTNFNPAGNNSGHQHLEEDWFS